MIYENFHCVERYLEKYAAKNPDHTAIIVKDEYTSYGTLWELVRGFAKFLANECGVQKGDRVVVKTM